MEFMDLLQLYRSILPLQISFSNEFQTMSIIYFFHFLFFLVTVFTFLCRRLTYFLFDLFLAFYYFVFFFSNFQINIETICLCCFNLKKKTSFRVYILLSFDQFRYPCKHFQSKHRIYPSPKKVPLCSVIRSFFAPSKHSCAF